MTGSPIIIPTAPQFHFCQTVESHGWRMLAPYSWDADSATLSYVYQTATGEVQRLQLRETEAGIALSLPDRPSLSPALRSELTAAVTRMLNLDWDLRPFYQAMRAYEGYAWLEADGHGRILICPSIWEDLAKVLLTTNINWSQTVSLCQRLCQLGTAHASLAGCHAFPQPAQIASLDFDTLARKLRAGYRSAYLHELARKIDSGALDLDAWLELDSDAFYQAVKSLKGFGDYAAGSIARMYGYFDKIAIDSACRSMYADRHNGGARSSDDDIEAHYARYGRWRGLVMWMDIRRHFS